ncbi:hypothetical protein [Methanofollis formosanus]|nr:hypothetical protein [Methanofollis formosanus]
MGPCSLFRAGHRWDHHFIAARALSSRETAGTIVREGDGTF